MLERKMHFLMIMLLQVERLSREVEEKEREIHSLKGAVNSDSRDRERTASDLASISRELEERDRLVNQLKQSLSDQGEVMKERESELDSHKKLVREACDREATLKQRCSELEQKHAREVEQLKAQVKATTERFESVERETLTTTENRESLSELQRELGQSRTLLDDTKQEMARILSEKEGLVKQRDEMVTDLSKKLDIAKDELRQARADVLRVSAEKEMLNHQRNALQTEVASLSQFRGQLESKVRSLEAGGRSLEEELSQKLEAKEEECLRFSRQLANLKAHLIEVCSTHAHVCACSGHSGSSMW